MYNNTKHQILKKTQIKDEEYTNTITFLNLSKRMNEKASSNCDLINCALIKKKIHFNRDINRFSSNFSATVDCRYEKGNRDNEEHCDHKLNTAQE